MATAAVLETELRANTTNFQANIAKSVESINKLSKTIAELEIAKIGIEFVSGAFEKLFELVRSGTEVIEKLVDTSQNLGIATGKLQELQFAAGQSGLTVDQLTQSLSFMEKNIGKAFSGSGSTALLDTFKKLGVSIEQLKGLKPEEQFNLLGTAIGKIEDPAARAFAAVTIFGRSGIKDIGLFRKGIGNLTSEFQSFGGELTTKQTSAVKSYADSLKKLSAIWEAFKLQLTAAVAGPFKLIIDYISQTIIQMGGVGKAAQLFAKYMIGAVQSTISGFSSILNVADSVIIKFEQIIKLLLQINKYGTLGISTLFTNISADIDGLSKDIKSRQDSIANRTNTGAAISKGLDGLNSRITDQRGSSDSSKSEITVKINAEEGLSATVANSSAISSKIVEIFSNAITGSAMQAGK